MRCDNRRIRATLFIILCVAVAISLISLSPIEARSQTSTRDRDAAKADMLARQRALWDLDRMKRKLSKKESAQSSLKYQQIREDFEQLQVVNYNLSGDVGASFNYGEIRKEAAEVKKRAARLKINLSLPEPTKDEKGNKSSEEFSRMELKAAINALDALVKTFVANPIFQQPGVVDMGNSGRARRDLEEIIRVSEHINRCAESLSRTTGKN
jgi:hypothetical protein